MAKYDVMIQQKKLRVKNNIESINKVCEELISLDENITYKSISGKTMIPIKTLQNSSYKECITNWKGIQKIRENNEESNVYLEDIKYLKKIIQQLRKQNEQLKYELYTQRTK
ncbi:hypothetical protein [Clostridium cibarium]|uniref:DUF5082 domain-containing protein n=1 Tax=Clostridium cibarium TaxID=2762247 RepID=A0ABR8PPE3_9CLOT|nr:hypothetical protein [Clostridium cibarium]MBD7910042.1 hypothetical protein [Clostridium cibarium]